MPAFLFSQLRLQVLDAYAGWGYCLFNEANNPGATDMTNTNEMGEAFETFLAAGKTDSKGREIGYIVGLRDNGVDFYAWVQNARKVDGDWSDFGVRQRSVKFADKDAARRWAYATAKERIAKLA